MDYRRLLEDLAGAAALTVIGVTLIVFLPLIGG
jgi:hypothetical protein